MNNTNMYEIYCSQGQGTSHGPKFQKLPDALRYVSNYGGPGSLAIRCPNGSWYRWAEEKATIKNQRRHSRITVFLAGELKPASVSVVVRTVSKRGMSVILPKAQTVNHGAKLKIRLKLDHVPLEFPVQVAWFHESQAGFQLESTAISPANLRRWEAWIARRS